MVRQIFHNRIPIPVRLVLSPLRGLVYHIAVPVLLRLQRAARDGLNRFRNLLHLHAEKPGPFRVTDNHHIVAVFRPVRLDNKVVPGAIRVHIVVIRKSRADPGRPCLGHNSSPVRLPVCLRRQNPLYRQLIALGTAQFPHIVAPHEQGPPDPLPSVFRRIIRIGNDAEAAA